MAQDTQDFRKRADEDLTAMLARKEFSPAEVWNVVNDLLAERRYIVSIDAAFSICVQRSSLHVMRISKLRQTLHAILTHLLSPDVRDLIVRALDMDDEMRDRDPAANRSPSPTIPPAHINDLNALEQAIEEMLTPHMRALVAKRKNQIKAASAPDEREHEYPYDDGTGQRYRILDNGQHVFERDENPA